MGVCCSATELGLSSSAGGTTLVPCPQLNIPCSVWRGVCAIPCCSARAFPALCHGNSAISAGSGNPTFSRKPGQVKEMLWEADFLRRRVSWLQGCKRHKKSLGMKAGIWGSMGYISTAFLLLLALLSHKHLQQFEQHTFPSAVTNKYQGKGRFIYLFFSIIFYLLLEHNAIDFNQNHFGIFFQCGCFCSFW